MPPIKLTIIGAGSRFTFGIIADLIRSPEWAGSVVALVDTNPQALGLSSRIADRMVAETGAKLTIESSVDRREVLPGSGFVLNSISVGEPWARERDVEIGERYGIYQPTSQTIGPAGFVRGLRVVPHAVAIAHDVAELCPDALVLDLANPLAAVCRSMIREAGLKVVGLCEAWRSTLPAFANLLDVDAGELDCLAAGTNHLTWALALYHRGVDRLPEFLTRLDTEEGQAILESLPVSQEVYAAMGLWPMGTENHIAEWFPYFLTPETHGGMDYNVAIRHTTQEDYRQVWAEREAWADGTKPIDVLLGPSGENAVEIIASYLNVEDPAVHMVNIPNQGLIDNLPPEAIVELPAYVSGGSVRGLKVGPLPQPIAQIVSGRVVQQELLVDAALSGDRHIAMQGLVLDAQIVSLRAAWEILEASLDANAEWLPNFHR